MLVGVLCRDGHSDPGKRNRPARTRPVTARRSREPRRSACGCIRKLGGGAGAANKRTPAAGGLPTGYAGRDVDLTPARHGVVKESTPCRAGLARQKCIFNASWITRGRFSCRVTCPNEPLPNVIFGAPNCGRLNALKNSARNSARTDSLMGMCFVMVMSKFLIPSMR